MVRIGGGAVNVVGQWDEGVWIDECDARIVQRFLLLDEPSGFLGLLLELLGLGCLGYRFQPASVATRMEPNQDRAAVE